MRQMIAYWLKAISKNEACNKNELKVLRMAITLARIANFKKPIFIKSNLLCVMNNGKGKDKKDKDEKDKDRALDADEAVVIIKEELKDHKDFIKKNRGKVDVEFNDRKNKRRKKIYLPLKILKDENFIIDNYSSSDRKHEIQLIPVDDPYDKESTEG